MLERLEAADRAVELLALLEVADGLRQAPVGQAELLGGEQSGAGPQRAAYGGFGLAQAAGRCGVEDDPRHRAGQVQGGLRGDGRVRCGHRVQAAVVGGNQEDVGRGGVGDGGQLAVQGAVLQAGGGEGGVRGGVQGDGERPDPRTGGQLAEQVTGRLAGPARQQCLRGDDGARQVRHGRDRAAQFLQDDGGLAVRGALAAEFLGDEESGEAHALGERLPQPYVVPGLRLGAGEDARRVAVVGEQIADGGAQRLFLLGVEQVGLCAHRARSFQATSLSVRGSAGRPRTRSATMFSSTSLVPPSMLLPLERR